MAKDPAVLWYYNDYLGGTEYMSFEEQGAYARLLSQQADKGHLSIEIIEGVLKKSFKKLWPKIQKKFIKDFDGNFYNERMDIERDKRKRFVEHQIENGKKGGRPIKNENPNNNPKITHGLANQKPLENEIINEVVLEEKGGRGEKETFCDFPKQENFTGELPTNQQDVAKEIYKMRWKVDLTSEQVAIFWHIFKVKNLTGQRFYPNEGAVYSHFIDWIKFQKIEQNGATKLNKNEQRVTGILKAATGRNSNR